MVYNFDKTSTAINEDKRDLDKPKYHYWHSETYQKTYFKTTHDKKFRYYDDTKFLKYLFFDWVHKWANYSTNSYVEPYKCHPLPIADQVLYWQPIFSKHVSDGLVRLENYETNKSRSNKDEYVNLPYKSILLRASLLTFWKRTLFSLLGIIATNILSMSISFLVKKLLDILNDKNFGFFEIVFLILSIILLQVLDGLLIDNFTFIIYRLVCMVQYIFSITLFQHGLCHRRKYYNNVEGSNALSVCNNVLHSCSPDSECSKNPLYCQARRYQNKPIAPNLFTIDFTDIFYISIFLESLVCVVQFLSNFVYGVLLMSLQIKMNLWVLYVVGLCFVLLMVFIEVFNTYVFKLIFWFRDFRISKCLNIIPSLPIINKMLLDDVAMNVILDVRNNELMLYMLRLFLAFFNRSLFTVCINVSFYIIKLYFLKSIDEAEVVTDIDTAALMTTFYIFLRIINSMILIPIAIKLMTVGIVSFRRTNRFLFDCSPNFYVSDNKFTGKMKMTTDLNNKTNQLNKDVVVLYKDATFTWINNRKDLLTNNYQPYLKNINFELKRGEVAIITGSQGSGKSNFIKSVLGEMTLVGGSMAVVPLHTSMPIFYASQDIWLKKGTIRSNILFGYKFDESLYNVVLKAVELEYDISTWERGDMRVVSDNAHTLSGGQRVRMEMARAIYAYMVFSQVNNQYNEGKCSFLMCLDSSFNGLDPFVSKTIFNNLFNAKSGLLAKNDLSVILSTSKRSLDKFVGSSDSYSFNHVKVFNINKGVFSFCCNFSDYLKNRNNAFLYSSDFSSALSNETYLMNFLSDDMLKLCSSGSLSREGRKLVTNAKYADSYKSYVLDLMYANYNPYFTYFKAAGVNIFIFMLLTLVLTVMDNVKFVFSTNLCDYITNNIDDYNNGQVVDMSEIRSKSRYYKNMVLIFVVVIVVLSFLSCIFMTLASITASIRINEYSVKSIFTNTSELLKIKKQIGQMVTFFSCDMIIIDDDLSPCMAAALVSLIYTIIHVVTLFYLVPMSIPFFVFTLILIYRFVLVQYVTASKNLQFGYLEATAQINNVFESAISGSSTYRSFKKEFEFLSSVLQDDDYKTRCRFTILALRIWASILFNWVFSFATYVVLVVLILFDRFTGFKLNVGYFGLSLSLSMNVVKSFTTFSMTFTGLGMFMCNIYRFRSFIPEGSTFKFFKRINTHDETISVNNYPQHDYKVNQNKLMDRRLVEFRDVNKSFRGLKKLFFNPKINVVDVTQYVTPEHSGVELKDVRVYTSLEKNVEGMILKGLTVSAHKSDIIGIIGRTGAGKTTLLSVLENTMRNRTGQVLLDGKDLNDIPKNVTRQIIGVLPQLPFVFKGWTVRRFLDPRKLFSDDEINEALDNCGLLDFVNNLQGGKKLDSVVIPEDIDMSKMRSGHDSDMANLYDKSYTADMNSPDFNKFLLSSSQLRTLSFARLVLYRYFYRMIIIDEPPSENCEDGDENANFLVQDVGLPIYELLQKYFKHCTSFVTAHDVNVLKMCSSVWVIHDGRLIRTCKSSDISANESIFNIIEQSIKNNY